MKLNDSHSQTFEEARPSVEPARPTETLPPEKLDELIRETTEERAVEEKQRLRDELSAIDREIHALSKRRLELVRDIFRPKFILGEAVYQGKQEQVKIKNLEDELAKEGLSPFESRGHARNLQKRIRASREAQYIELFDIYRNFLSSVPETAGNADAWAEPFTAWSDAISRIEQQAEENPDDREAQDRRAALNRMLEHYAFAPGEAIAAALRSETFSPRTAVAPSPLSRKLEEALRARYPELEISYTMAQSDPLEAVRSGEVDAALILTGQTPACNPYSRNLLLKLAQEGLFLAKLFKFERRYRLYMQEGSCPGDIVSVVGEAHHLQAFSPKLEKLGWRKQTSRPGEGAGRLFLELMERDDAGYAVILSEEEAEHFGLVPVPSWEEDVCEQTMSLAVVSRELAIDAAATKLSFTCRIADQVGGLANVIDTIADYDLGVDALYVCDSPDLSYQRQIAVVLDATPETPDLFPFLYQMNQEYLGFHLLGWLNEEVLEI